MTRAKFPYTLKVRDVALGNFMLHTATFNAGLFKRYRYRATSVLMKDTLEREVSKFTCERDSRDYRSWPLLAGAALALGCFVWTHQSRRLRDDLHDPGRDIIYAGPLSTWLRLFRMLAFGHLSTGLMLFAELPSKKETRTAGWQTAKWKKEYLIARRMRLFQRRRRTELDFLDLGNPDLYLLPH